MGRVSNRDALSTSEARKSLPSLAKRAARQTKPGKSLRANAVAIQPRGESRRALLVPEVDVEATERYIEELEETIEDIELMRLIEERTATVEETGTPLAEVIREFGQEDLVGEGPAA